MKKRLFTLTLLSAVLTAHVSADDEGVYQIPNSDFELWNSTNEPGNGWNSFASASGTYSSFSSSSPQPSKVSGYSGDYAVKIYSKKVISPKANGNLTTGRINMGNMTPSNASNYNYTDTTSSDHSIVLAGTPDAARFYARFMPSASDINGRGQFILHNKYEYKDPETSNNSDYLNYKVGIASILIQACNEWTYFEGDFEYTGVNAIEGKQYILASFTTNPTPGGSAGDTLYIDEVRLIYRSELDTLIYNGVDIYESGTTSYSLADQEYDASKLSCSSNGRAATIETSYDNTTALLTITVNGDNISDDATNYHTYTVQFKAPETGLSSLTASGTELLSAGEYAYDLSSSYYDADQLSYTTAEEGATVETSYDASTAVLTITVKGSDWSEENDNAVVYTIQFKTASSALTSLTYNGTEILAENTYAYDLSSSKYDESLLAYTAEDEGATVETAYDDETAKLTITVKGGDWSESNANETVYTIQFKAAVIGLTSLSYDGTELLEEDVYAYDLSSAYYDADLVSITVADESLTYTCSYDVNTAVMTITLDGEEEAEYPTYTVQFKTASSKLSSLTYNGTELLAEDTYAYDLSTTQYDESQLTYTKADEGATVETSYNSESALLTITVKGGDWSESNANASTYTIQFSTNTQVSVNAVQAAGSIEPFDVYTVDGKTVRTNATSLDGLKKGVYVVNGKKVIKK